MLWTSLLVALAASGGGNARARTQELRGRLGLQARNAPALRGWRARINYIRQQHGDAIATMTEQMLNLLTNAAVENTPYDPMLPWIARELAGAPPAGLFDFAQEMLNALPMLLDYYQAQRPDLMRMSFPELVEASHAWHVAEVPAAGLAVPGEVVWRWEDGWTLQRLTQRNQLDGEGAEMRHCVGSAYYMDRIRKGQSQILSMRDPEGRPRVTIELGENDALRQFYGPSNSYPGAALRRRFDDYFQHLLEQRHGRFNPEEGLVREWEDGWKLYHPTDQAAYSQLKAALVGAGYHPNFHMMGNLADRRHFFLLNPAGRVMLYFVLPLPGEEKLPPQWEGHRGLRMSVIQEGTGMLMLRRGTRAWWDAITPKSRAYWRAMWYAMGLPGNPKPDYGQLLQRRPDGWTWFRLDSAEQWNEEMDWMTPIRLRDQRTYLRPSSIWASLRTPEGIPTAIVELDAITLIPIKIWISRAVFWEKPVAVTAAMIAEGEELLREWVVQHPDQVAGMLRSTTGPVRQLSRQQLIEQLRQAQKGSRSRRLPEAAVDVFLDAVQQGRDLMAQFGLPDSHLTVEVSASADPYTRRDPRSSTVIRLRNGSMFVDRLGSHEPQRRDQPMLSVRAMVPRWHPASRSMFFGVERRGERVLVERYLFRDEGGRYGGVVTVGSRPRYAQVS